MAEARRIGGDWVENTDPSSGKKYYANVTTQETRWTWPDDIPKEDPPDDWESRVDPSSGKTYYVNLKTQETQWTKPGSSATWIESTDPASGRNYYINSATNEVTWEKPAGFDDQSAEPKKEEPKKEEPKKEEPKKEEPKKEEPKKEEPQKDDKFAKLRKLKSNQKVDSGEQKSNNSEYSEKEILSGGGHELSQAEKEKLKELATVDVGEIEEAKMEDWAKPTEEGGLGKFNLDRKGIFGKRTKVEKILSFKKDLIKTALLKLNSSMNVEAVQAFKNVVSFMGDRTTRKDAGGHAQKLMKNTLHAPEELRDEIFCQMIKQTTNNPNQYSTSRGWQLMAIAAGTYPPSREFMPYLMYYCEIHKNDPDGIGELAKGVQMRIKRIMDQGKCYMLICFGTTILTQIYIPPPPLSC
jgi:hypothetical protein